MGTLCCVYMMCCSEENVPCDMLSVLLKVRDYVWGGEENLETTENGRNATGNLYSDHQAANQAGNSSSSGVLAQQLNKNFHGTITKLYDGCGVIDNDVYFTFGVILGGIRPQVGDEVHVEASRTAETSGWQATRVQLVSDSWDHTNDGGVYTEKENFIGLITNLTTDVVTVDDSVDFPLSCLRSGYVAHKGDWVKLFLSRRADGLARVEGAMPVRERSFTGTVSSVAPGYGFIDDEVYFSFRICSRYYRPHKGDLVRLTAVESQQGRANWRAVKVEPKLNSASLRPPSGSQQFLGGKTAELLRGKEGLSISGPVDMGSVTAGECRKLPLQIRNAGETSKTFQACFFIRHDPQFEIQLLNNGEKSNEDAMPTLAPGMEILPQGTEQILVKFHAKDLGRVSQLLVFTFDGGVELGRYLTADVQDPTQKFLQASVPYQDPKNNRRKKREKQMQGVDREQWVIPGERPVRKRKLFLPVKLKSYDIPRDIRRCIVERQDLVTIVPAAGEPLLLENHQARFSALLFAEEMQMELEMREFDMERVTMDPYGEFLCLKVPGLAEGRPSLLIGDKVVVSLPDAAADTPKYEGYIHEVRKDDILVKFHDEFHRAFSAHECDVMFFFNRTSIRRAHQAVEFGQTLGERVLFPSAFSPKLPVVSLTLTSKQDNNQAEQFSSPQRRQGTEGNPPTDGFLYNPALNERQRAAVVRIVSGQCRPTPYLLYGPPGTGKTVTLVEAVLQVLHRLPSSRVLACAPSNSAADLIAERLHLSGVVKPGDLVRLNAFQRAQRPPDVIVPYCVDADELEAAARHRLVVCTCSTAGQLFSLGLSVGHFTHVFVDEAGQATEPECLIPMGLAAGDEGQVVLAGDPHQLGPVLRSRVAISLGLNVSLLERLITRPLYRRDEDKFADHGCYDPLLVTKLINNYRSHPSLLKLPSAMFYHDELREFADKDTTERFCEWDRLPRRGFPLLFHGIKGEDFREGSSPSWFNPAEAVQVVRYLQALRSAEKNPLRMTDVGIITPYKKQVEKIRLLLDRVGLSEVKVGSVEEFQGQERLVIIISTVRSTEQLVGFDTRHTVGFLSNPKRFNVAITRAQALLIVVGNPHVLCQDPYWCCLLQYCVSNDAYTGCELPDLAEQTEQEEFQSVTRLLSRTSHLKEQHLDLHDENQDLLPDNYDSGLGREQRPNTLDKDHERHADNFVSGLTREERPSTHDKDQEPRFDNCDNGPNRGKRPNAHDKHQERHVDNFVSQSPKEQRPSTHDQDQEPHSDSCNSGLTETLQAAADPATPEVSLRESSAAAAEPVNCERGFSPAEDDSDEDLEEFVFRPRTENF